MHVEWNSFVARISLSRNFTARRTRFFFFNDERCFLFHCWLPLGGYIPEIIKGLMIIRSPRCVANLKARYFIIFLIVLPFSTNERMIIPRHSSVSEVLKVSFWLFFLFFSTLERGPLLYLVQGYEHHEKFFLYSSKRDRIFLLVRWLYCFSKITLNCCLLSWNIDYFSIYLFSIFYRFQPFQT